MPRTTILLVDDETYMRRMVSLGLERAQYSVLTASSGAQAYDIACRQRPDLVVTDYQMPGGDGLELCKKLRATEATARIPAILLTARGHRTDPSELARTSIRLMMSKPFSFHELLERIRELVVAEEGADEDAGAEATAA